MSRDYPLGFGAETIPPDETVLVLAIPEKAFMPRELITLGCDGLLINGIMLDGYTIFSSNPGVRAEHFAPGGKPEYEIERSAVSEFRPCLIGVENPTDEPLIFRASLVGRLAPKYLEPLPGSH